jgi:signal transduction histidine kinase
MTALAAVPHQVGVHVARWARLPSLRVLGLALVFGVIASTQYLFQPFVWRNWPVDEVLLGWFTVLVDRLAVALTMGLAVAAALAAMQQLPDARPVMRGAIFVALAMAGAVAGELLLTVLEERGDSATAGEILLRSLRWAVAALAVAGLRLAWLRSLRAQSAVREHEVARLQADGQVTSLRLQALQAQIEPHFLFNTLATVRRLGSTEPAQCERLLAHLHDFIRLSRVGEGGLSGWSVGSEIELARAYLGVVEMRMRGLLRVHFEIDPAALGCDMPPLTLATLVENAVKHGITPSTSGGEIIVSAHRADGRLELTIIDSGVGFAPGVGGGSGIGLANTRARLRSLYGTHGRLELSARSPHGVVARLQLPAREVSR